MLELTLSEYSDALASKAPIPGGGGVAAYVGGLGAALCSMVGNLTLGKKKYAQVQDEISELIAKADTLRKELERLSEADAEVFEPLSRAYGLPSKTEEEKAEKDKVLQPALVGAAEVPLEVCRKLGDALNLLERMGQIGTRIAISDVGVGAAFVKAALVSAEMNVLINTGMVKDSAVKTRMEAEAAELVAKGTAKADQIVVGVRSGLVR